jgi:hypothetical protein
MRRSADTLRRRMSATLSRSALRGHLSFAAGGDEPVTPHASCRSGTPQRSTQRLRHWRALLWCLVVACQASSVPHKQAGAGVTGSGAGASGAHSAADASSADSSTDASSADSGADAATSDAATSDAATSGAAARGADWGADAATSDAATLPDVGGLCTYNSQAGPTPGCVTGTPADCGTAPSYRTEVSTIISTYCVSCHRAGGLAPDRPVDTYQRIYSMRTDMLGRVSRCLMPPACAAQPSADEHATLVRWFVCGAPNN